ncbi:hypothetical protein [Paludisphaera soli]|uniref:hypothetical protein n=1 Tax=Paludisphaera soli TaxID=2712865 RepID=UPI0013EB3BB1|nr:hypothetical protein [Paludisphaera soli]
MLTGPNPTRDEIGDAFLEVRRYVRTQPAYALRHINELLYLLTTVSGGGRECGLDNP